MASEFGKSPALVQHVVVAKVIIRVLHWDLGTDSCRDNTLLLMAVAVVLV